MDTASQEPKEARKIKSGHVHVHAVMNVNVHIINICMMYMNYVCTLCVCNSTVETAMQLSV